MQTRNYTTPEFDFSAWQDDLAARFGSSFAKTVPENTCLEDFLHQVENTLNAGLRKEDHDNIACGAGCGACCKVNVAVLRPEAHNIAAYLRRALSVAELDALCERMRRLLVVIRGLDEDERIAANQSCAFLDAQGSCSIYPVRPLLCRSITSTCAEACRSALQINMFDEPRPIVMNMFQKDLMDSAFKALANMWKENGGDSRSQELTAAVYQLLQN